VGTSWRFADRRNDEADSVPAAGIGGASCDSDQSLNADEEVDDDVDEEDDEGDEDEEAAASDKCEDTNGDNLRTLPLGAAADAVSGTDTAGERTIDPIRGAAATAEDDDVDDDDEEADETDVDGAAETDGADKGPADGGEAAPAAAPETTGVAVLLIRSRLRMPGMTAAAARDDDNGEKLEEAATARLGACARVQEVEVTYENNKHAVNNLKDKVETRYKTCIN
jgi:hypothetical protein